MTRCLREWHQTKNMWFFVCARSWLQLFLYYCLLLVNDLVIISVNINCYYFSVRKCLNLELYYTIPSCFSTRLSCHSMSVPGTQLSTNKHMHIFRKWTLVLFFISNRFSESGFNAGSIYDVSLVRTAVFWHSNCKYAVIGINIRLAVHILSSPEAWFMFRCMYCPWPQPSMQLPRKVTTPCNCYWFACLQVISGFVAH